MEMAVLIGLWLLLGMLVLATLLPLCKLPVGALRGLEFPRQQYFGFACLGAVLAPVFVPDWLGGNGLYVFLALAAVQLFYIAKFTPLWRRQSERADAALMADRDCHIRLLASNVKKSNRDYAALIRLVRDRDPDMVMAIEVDADWRDALRKEFAQEYPHWIEEPRDNGYGMCVFSRLPLSDMDVREVVTRDVPSVRTTVRLRSGDDVRLFVVHPEPPVIDHDTKGRDSEIALHGLEAAQSDLPAIVAGDLNDVAWSTTTRRFQRLSGLLDPRVGRGFYNTFSATMPWMRWPLDHLFHHPKFRLVEMARLPHIGSDHFPMWFVLALARSAAERPGPPAADDAERFATKRMIVEEQQRDRDPIGGDWEDEEGRADDR